MCMHACGHCNVAPYPSPAPPPPPPPMQDAAGVLSLSSHQLGTTPLNRITLTYPDHHYVIATTKVGGGCALFTLCWLAVHRTTIRVQSTCSATHTPLLARPGFRLATPRHFTPVHPACRLWAAFPGCRPTYSFARSQTAGWSRQSRRGGGELGRLSRSCWDHRSASQPGEPTFWEPCL
jgi:hypothetical protein